MSDLISRQAAIDDLHGKDPSQVWDTADVEVWIKALPSADVQPVRYGNWEERKVSDKNCIDEWQTACCSVCHKYHTTPYMYYFDNYNYCPNCGARMDGAT